MVAKIGVSAGCASDAGAMLDRAARLMEASEQPLILLAMRGRHGAKTPTQTFVDLTMTKLRRQVQMIMADSISVGSSLTCRFLF